MKRFTLNVKYIDREKTMGRFMPKQDIKLKNKASRRFTLLELLVVIAIIGILITLLLPSLRRARYVAKVAVCASNLKMQGTAYTLYATDNNRFFPANAKWSDLDINGGTVDSRYVLRSSLQTIAHDTFKPLNMLLPYFAGGTASSLQGARLGYTCPLVEEKYSDKHSYDSNGDDHKDSVRFPYPSTHANISTYSIWPNFYRNDSKVWSVAEGGAMRLLGEPWRLGGHRANASLPEYDRDDVWSHVMASDINSNFTINGTVWLTNHYPIYRGGYIDYEFPSYQSNGSGFVWGANGAAQGWVSRGRSMSSNYLFDDGRVVVRKGITGQNSTGNANWTGWRIPKDFFQEGN
jgi:prepilin-type N-terminal cleavage/methylation domain-containing protein